MAPSTDRLAAWPSEVRQKGLELRRGELARRHGKIGVLDRAQPRDVARDRHVVRRVGEQHVRLVGPQHVGVALGLQGVAAEQAMLAKDPKVAQAAHRRGAGVDRRQFVFLIDAAAVQQDVDLAHLEAADFEIDLRGKFQDLGELEGERLAVPCGIVGNAVERQPQRPQLGLGQVRQADRRHLAEAQLPCGQHQSPAGNDPPLGSIRIGRTKPNRSRLAASLRTCCGGCLRLSRPRGLQPATGTSRGVKSRERT